MTLITSWAFGMAETINAVLYELTYEITNPPFWDVWLLWPLLGPLIAPLFLLLSVISSEICTYNCNCSCWIRTRRALVKGNPERIDSFHCRVVGEEAIVTY